MPELDERQRLYIILLVEALKRFYKNDANDLFDDETGTDERSMVACVFYYMKCHRENPEFKELEPDIDIEYNRMIDSEDGWVRKSFDTISADHVSKCPFYDSHGASIYKSCGYLIKTKLDELDAGECDHCKKKFFRPDLIVHKRKSKPGTGNGLIVEFKKATAERMNYDKAKVRACTCERGGFNYKVGAFVILDKVFAQVYVFSGGQYRGKFSVDKDGRKESSPDGSQVCQEA